MALLDKTYHIQIFVKDRIKPSIGYIAVSRFPLPLPEQYRVRSATPCLHKLVRG